MNGRFVPGACAIIFLAGCTGHEGCSPPPDPAMAPNTTIVDVAVGIEPGFTDEQRADIMLALDLWAAATNGFIRWHDVASEARSTDNPLINVEKTVVRSTVFHHTSSKTERVKEMDETVKKPAVTFGKCFPSDSAADGSDLYLVMDRLRRRADLTTTAAHEFGHAIGLHHTTSPETIMAENANPNVRCITKQDINEFCLAFNCDSTHLVEACF